MATPPSTSLATKPRRRRSVVSAVLAAALLGPAIAGPFSPAHADEIENLSQGRPVEATSSENSVVFPATAAVDGDFGTRWASEFTDTQAITVELAEVSALDRVELTWEAAYGKRFAIQISDDGNSWLTAATITEGVGGFQEIDLQGNDAKFVRLQGIERATGYGYSLWELQVFGTVGTGGGTVDPPGPGECGTTNAALGAVATANSFENETWYPASNAIDGNPTSRWSSAVVDDAALTIDLGSAQNVCGVVLDWEGAYGKAYDIQLSTDGQSWSTAASVTDGDGGQDVVAVAGSARYVRIQGVERGTGYGYSLWEVAIHTSGGGTVDPGDPPDPTDPTNPYPDYVNPGYPGPVGPAVGPSNVEVVPFGEGWRLEVNGQPYTVRGLTWGPPNWEIDNYMPHLAAMGANTTRTWGTGPESEQLFDAAADAGIRVIAGFWLVPGGGPGSGGCISYQGDSQYKQDVRRDILAAVEQYKNHPAVLMWSVGNESILGMGNCYGGAELEAERNAYTQFVNEMALAIKAIDPNHPVSSTDAWTGAWPYYQANSPALDLLQLNSYGDICGVADYWEENGYDRPYIITEGGNAGEWEVPDDANGVPLEPSDIEKANAYVESWKCIMEHKDKALGATMFHFGVEGDFGGVWFNVIPGGNKRLTYYALSKAWGVDIDASNTPPQFSELSVVGNGTVEAGEVLTIKADVADPDGDAMNYVAFFNSNYIDGSWGLEWVEATEVSPATFQVIAPQKLGVWKFYLWAEDGQGNVGVETLSFRVVAPEVAGTNIALGKPAEASSFDPWNGNYTPGQAFDGDPGTRWSSAWNDNEWIQVDLGSVQSFNTIQLVWETAFASAYEIQVSNDGQSWTTVTGVTNGDGGIDTLNVNGTGRYVKLQLSQRGTAWGYSLYEMGIYS